MSEPLKIVTDGWAIELIPEDREPTLLTEDGWVDVFHDRDEAVDVQEQILAETKIRKVRVTVEVLPK